MTTPDTHSSGIQKWIHLPLFSAICLLFFANSHAAYNVDPGLVWYTAKTPHFHIHYHQELAPLVPEVAQIAEKAHHRITVFFNWEPDEPTQLILTDRMDAVNGFAYPMPRNTMTIFVSPPDDIDVLGDYHDWLDLVISHEYTHVVHLDKVSGIPQGGRNIFGRAFLFFPNLFQPLWIIEGLATYHESQLYPDIGRGRSSAFRSIMRMEVANGIKPLSFVNMPVVTWPSGNSRYLYGVYFFNFLVERYGIENVRRWIDHYSNNLIPFQLNNNSKTSFSGKDMSTLWAEFSMYLENKFQAQIENINRQELYEGRQITRTGYFTGFPRTDSNGNLYFYQHDLLSESKLMKLANGASKAEPITEIHSGRFDVHPDAGILVSQLDAYRNTNWFADLYIVNPETRDIRQITHGQRYKHAAWSPDASRIVAVQTIMGQSRLHLLSAQGKFLETLWSGQDDVVVSQIDWSPDGKSVVAPVWRPGTRWNLELFDIDKRQWKQLFETTISEFQAHYSHDGRFIYYSADPDGVFNIYRYEVATGNIAKQTHVMGSAVSASPTPDGNGLYYMGLNSNGTDIYYIESRNSAETVTADLMKPLDTGPLVDINAGNIVSSGNVSNSAADPAILNTEPYTALDKISPTAWFPYAVFDDEREEIGFTIAGADPLFRHSYILLGAYDIEHNWGLGLIDYRYDRWNPSLKLFAQREVITIFDNNDEVDSYRNSDTLTAELLYPFLKRDYQWTIHLGTSIEEQSDKKLVTRTFKVERFRDHLVGLGMTFNSARQFPRGISLQDGDRLRLVYEDSDSFNSDFTGQVGTADWRSYFSLTSSQVLATRLVLGYGNESPNPFRLGGTDDGFIMASPGSTLAEPTEEVLNKRKYALRGYPEGLIDLTGRRMILANLEYRFPISLVQRTFMAPPVGLHQVHGTVFYSAGDAWNEGGDYEELSRSAGIEINTELVLGYFIPINLRLGFAHGIDNGGDDEAYIELGGSF